MLNIKDALADAGAYLKGKGAATPSLDAEVLLANTLGLSRVGLYANWERRLSDSEAGLFFELLVRRGEGVPVAYLVGHKEFMGLRFAVNPHVLIPRPETELLVEKALEVLSKPSAAPYGGEKGFSGTGKMTGKGDGDGFPGYLPTVVDVGTGSGAIAISLAKYNPGVRIFAIDISREALKVAAMNAERHGVSDRVFFLCGDLLEPLGDLPEPLGNLPEPTEGKSPQAKAKEGCGREGSVSLIAANLPYIAGKEVPTLPREVGYEPLLALDGGPDGLALLRRLIPQACKWLSPGGYLLAEIGAAQGETARAIIREYSGNKMSAQLLVDLAGRDRLLCAQKVYN